MVEEIQKWFNSSRDYHTGVDIYLKYGKDSRLINSFTENKVTPFKKQLLLDTLTQMMATGATQAPKKEAEAPKTEKHWPEDSKDDILNSLRSQWRPLYGKMTNLQARIHDIAERGQKDPEARLQAGQMAKEIVFLNKRIREIYAQKSYYEKNGSLPESTDKKIPEEVVSIGQLFKMRENECRYLRQATRRLKELKEDDPKRVGLILKAQSHEKTIIELNIKLERPEYEGIPARHTNNS